MLHLSLNSSVKETVNIIIINISFFVSNVSAGSAVSAVKCQVFLQPIFINLMNGMNGIQIFYILMQCT
jgi:hypothetical protein